MIGELVKVLENIITYNTSINKELLKTLEEITIVIANTQKFRIVYKLCGAEKCIKRGNKAIMYMKKIVRVLETKS